MPTTKPISISIPIDVLDTIDDLAARQERSRSQVIARAIRASVSAGDGHNLPERPPGGVPVRHPAAEA